MYHLRTLSLILAGAIALAGCEQQKVEGAPAPQRTYMGPDHAPAEVHPEEAERRTCEARMREALAEPALPGAPAIEAARAVLLARTKAEPLLFTDTPRHGPEEVTLTVKGYRQMLDTSRNAYGVISRVLTGTQGYQKNARDSLLKDGYLYADTPEMAYALVSLVQPHQLFGVPRIWIQRGDAVVHAERRHGRYFYTDGPLEGERVRLALFDRAGAGEEPPAPLHLDLRSLRYRLHFDRMQIRHVTAKGIVANVRYGKFWVPTVLSSNGARLYLVCESLAPHLKAELARWREQGERRQRAVQVLRRSMLAQLDEAIPFDEPIREYGFQLDGTLRARWEKAYRLQRHSFALNGDEYQVFDTEGRALTPQVCVDFLTDTFERASGTWFRPRGAEPGRVLGKLDFDAMGLARHELRRVPGFVALAKSRPDWFEVKDDSEQIEMGDRERFLAYLGEHADDFAPGDAVLIKGKTPWDPRHVHFHSFFIYESDPLTGMPLVVVGNAGRPTLRSWETEMRRTPKRAIVYRIRPKTEWLESIAGIPPLEHVPPLAAGPE